MYIKENVIKIFSLISNTQKKFNEYGHNITLVMDHRFQKIYSI